MEYAALTALPGNDLGKRRFRRDVAGTLFGVDVFEHPHPGLMLCEVEAESLAKLAQIALPDWVGAEITDDPDFSGAALADERASIHR